MDRRAWFRWLAGLSAVALLAVAGVYLYDLGVARGLAEGARANGAAGAGLPIGAGWRPWGFGFGFFPFFPFLFVLLWIAVLRGFFWRGRPWYGRERYWHGGDGVPPAIEEWHRRAHERHEPPPAGASG
jgi:hypothetical protein